MTHILLQALGFFLIIIAGFLLKRLDVLSKKDGHVLSIIIMKLTLPAAIIIGLTGIKANLTFFLLIGLGVLLNVLLIPIGNILFRKRDILDKSLMMYDISGYNIGNFAFPFVQGFLPQAIPFICMFDIGNCFMIAGGSVVMIDHLTKVNEMPPKVTDIAKKLLHSVPFVTYLTMMILKLFSIEIPSGPLSIIQLFANANGFLSMLMIGLFMELRLPRKDAKTVLQVLVSRYSIAIILALLIYFVIPFPSLMKTALVLVVLAPITTFAIVNKIKAGISEGITGFISSCSILISLILMTIAMLLML